ncbi:nucleoside hydrolase [Agreia sp. COWG]|uniref:nucleoside hydrolase n=1 Tax=Agreia sp. COWG TaxID=2773266 RepID=UPI0019297AC1|nr:nucleoside hydrolase [Agreia sp. COWG]CAD5994949.1 Inosine-uridine preferring nucleoside hydrolase [Agreia sp. COWG]
MPQRPYLLDCDTGVDDALALFHLLSDPEVDLVGVSTVSGNTSAAQAAENTLRLLALAGRSDVPVAVGEHHFRMVDFDGGVPHIHGDNGIGGIELPSSAVGPSDESGAELIARLAREHRGELHLIAIGPLTNLALALEIEPELPSLIGALTIMGGAALAPGNSTPVAEANIACDPHAAELVFAADWNITMVGLDVTMKHLVEAPDRAALLSAPGRIAPVLGEMLGIYFDFYVSVFGRPCSALHDPLAVAIATGEVVPTLAPVVRVRVDATDGPGRGQTVCDMRGLYAGYPAQNGARVRVVLEVDQPYAPLLMKRLLSFD